MKEKLLQSFFQDKDHCIKHLGLRFPRGMPRPCQNNTLCSYPVITQWLGGDDRSRETGHLYSHRTKVPDLLGINRDNRFVICEFKVQGGRIDQGPLQLLEYYLMLQENESFRAKLVQDNLELEGFDFRDTQLYLVFWGYLSLLARKRMEILREYCQHKFPQRQMTFKAFKVIVSEKDVGTPEAWTVTECFSQESLTDEESVNNSF